MTGNGPERVIKSIELSLANCTAPELELFEIKSFIIPLILPFFISLKIEIKLLPVPDAKTVIFFTLTLIYPLPL